MAEIRTLTIEGAQAWARLRHALWSDEAERAALSDALPALFRKQL